LAILYLKDLKEIHRVILQIGIEGLNSYPDLHLQVAILLSGVYEKTDELIE
jgi:hypothetical protein